MNKPLNIKLVVLALLALVLAFAVKQVEWKVLERQSARDGAVRAIADQYAHEQQLAGPLLWLKCIEPRTLIETDDKGATRQRNIIQDCSRAIRPSLLSGQGNLDVAERYRGIYKARVYLAGLKLHAELPAFQAKPGQRIEEAHLIFGIGDPRGLKRIQISSQSPGSPKIDLAPSGGGSGFASRGQTRTRAGGEVLHAKPGVPGGPFEQGFHVPLDVSQLAQGIKLDAELEIAGSGRLDWAPLAENNDFSLRSAWPHPSFAGQFLPETREISSAGFSARWRVNDFATGGDRMLAGKTGTWLATSLGVSLVDPVDAYTQTDRAVRYGFLFVLLTLGGFFLFELLKAKPVHPLQYLLIGFAVVLFFLLLLALSEHTGFALAYLIAASACVLLIAGYGRSLLGNWQGAASLGAGYGLLYFGLYQLLASEDYALLMGAWLIFGLLALTMYLTRRLDWGRAGQSAAQVQ